MIRKFAQFLLLATLVASPVFGQEELGRVKALMHTLVMEIYRMRPYLASEKAFRSSEGQEAVKSSLNLINARLKNPPQMLKDAPGFRISYSLLADHVQRTKEVFDKGEMDLARMRLIGTTNLCAACHTQTPKISGGSPFAIFSELDNKPTFENALFLFVIRRWDVAMTQFNDLIRTYPSNKVTSDQLTEVYRMKLAVVARVKRDFKAGIESLNEDLKNSKLPSDIRQNIKDWTRNLEKLQRVKREDPESMSTKDLIELVSEKLPQQPLRNIAASDPQLIHLLYYSGLLYERLFKEGDGPNGQALLYYLAQCERSLYPVHWYSVADIYLKECVVRFPHQPYSKRCYSAYEDSMRERFSGQHPSESMQENIKALKEYL